MGLCCVGKLSLVLYYRTMLLNDAERLGLGSGSQNLKMSRTQTSNIFPYSHMFVLLCRMSYICKAQLEKSTCGFENISGWIVGLFRMPFLVENVNKRGRHLDPYPRKHIMDAYVLWMPLGLLGKSTNHWFYMQQTFE